MKKIKRILSFVMVCVIIISSANTGVYAVEIDEPIAMLEETVECTENQQKVPDVRDYNDLLEMEVVEIDPNEIEGEVYDADELATLAENVPALMSTSYNLYWDNYSSYYIYNHLSEDEQKLTGFGTYVRLKDEVSGEEFIYPAGSTKIYRPEGNVLCAKEVKLSHLRLEYFFEDDEE